MADVLVTRFSTSARDGNEPLTELGNPNTPQGGWRWNAASVIASIEAGTNTFFLRDPDTGKRLDIVVVHLPGEAPKLSAIEEGRVVDKLRSLAAFDSPSV